MHLVERVPGREHRDRNEGQDGQEERRTDRHATREPVYERNGQGESVGARYSNEYGDDVLSRCFVAHTSCLQRGQTSIRREGGPARTRGTKTSSIA